MVTYHCDRCAHDMPVEDFQVGSLVQCDSCGYISNVAPPAGAGSPVQAPPEKAIYRRPPPVQQRSVRPAAEPGRAPSRFLIGLVLVCFACTVAALVFGNPATRLFVPFVALAALNGYRVGGLKVVAAVLGLVIGAVLALPAGRACEGLVGRGLGLTGLTNRLASIVVAGILLAILAAFLLDLLIGRRLRRKPAVARLDKWVGSGLGMAQGVLIALVLLWGILTLEPVANARIAMASDGANAGQADPTASRIVSLARVIRASTVGRIADAANPLAEARIVTLPGKCLAMLNDPVALDSFNNHPAIKRVAERPVVKEVVKVLAEDPQISEILKSEENLSRGDLAVILGSPRLLEVLDHGNVMAELSPIADDIEEAVNQALDDAVAKSGGR